MKKIRNDDVLQSFVAHQFTGHILDKWLVKNGNKYIYSGEIPGIYETEDKDMFAECRKLSLLEISKLNCLTKKKFFVEEYPRISLLTGSKSYEFSLWSNELGWSTLFYAQDKNKAIRVCKYLNDRM